MVQSNGKQHDTYIAKKLSYLYSTLKSVLRIQLSNCVTKILNWCKLTRNSNWQERLQGIKVWYWIFLWDCPMWYTMVLDISKALTNLYSTSISLLGIELSKCVTRILNQCKPTRNSISQGRHWIIIKVLIFFCATVLCDTLWYSIFQRSYPLCPDVEITIENWIIKMCHQNLKSVQVYKEFSLMRDWSICNKSFFIVHSNTT